MEDVGVGVAVGAAVGVAVGTAVGAAVGAAATGLRPVAELMFVDFFGVCMDMIYNHMAKNIYMAGGNIRMPMDTQ